MNSFQCIACKHLGAKPFLMRCKDYYLGKRVLTDYVSCSKCELVQQSPLPQDVGAFYNEYPVHVQKSLIHRFFRNLLIYGIYFKPQQKKRLRILDFGCGDGGYLDMMKSRGHELAGFEANPEHAHHLSQALSLNVYGDRNELLEAGKNYFDAVTLHFVFEHLTDLDIVFRVAKILLKRTGKMFISVPNIHSWEAKIFGRKWHALDPPRHISFPDRQTMHALARKHGFILTDEKYLPFPNGIAGTLPVLLTGKFRFALFLLFLPISLLICRAFPSGTVGFTLQNTNGEVI